MKKLIGLFLCLVVISGLIGCSEKPKDEPKNFTFDPAMKRLADEIDNPAKRLEIQDDIELKIDGDYGYITGSVKNIGREPINYFEVRCFFMDDDSQVLDSTYTNSNILLNVGDMKKFEIMHKWDDKFKLYSLSINKDKLR